MMIIEIQLSTRWSYSPCKRVEFSVNQCESVNLRTKVFYGMHHYSMLLSGNIVTITHPVNPKPLAFALKLINSLKELKVIFERLVYFSKLIFFKMPKNNLNTSYYILYISKLIMLLDSL